MKYIKKYKIFESLDDIRMDIDDILLDIKDSINFQVTIYGEMKSPESYPARLYSTFQFNDNVINLIEIDRRFDSKSESNKLSDFELDSIKRLVDYITDKGYKCSMVICIPNKQGGLETKTLSVVWGFKFLSNVEFDQNTVLGIALLKK